MEAATAKVLGSASASAGLKASYHGHLACVETLLHARACVDLADEHGVAPLALLHDDLPLLQLHIALVLRTGGFGLGLGSSLK